MADGAIDRSRRIKSRGVLRHKCSRDAGRDKHNYLRCVCHLTLVTSRGGDQAGRGEKRERENKVGKEARVRNVTIIFIDLFGVAPPFAIYLA